MKLLTIREPWASLIIYGAKARNGKWVKKDIENRSWVPNIAMNGVRIGVHAGKSTAGLAGSLMDAEEIYGIVLLKSDLIFGAVLGSVELVTWVAHSKSKWFNGPVGFVLKDPFAYPKPIPCNGQLNFFTDPDISRTLARYERLRVAGKSAKRKQ